MDAATETENGLVQCCLTEDQHWEQIETMSTGSLGAAGDDIFWQSLESGFYYESPIFKDFMHETVNIHTKCLEPTKGANFMIFISYFLFGYYFKLKSFNEKVLRK